MRTIRSWATSWRTTTCESPFETASDNLQREDVQRALAALPRRDREVLELRYGLNGRQPMTLEEVGEAFGVTRERIRQIENNTLKRLKAPARGAVPARPGLAAWLTRGG